MRDKIVQITRLFSAWDSSESKDEGMKSIGRAEEGTTKLLRVDTLIAPDRGKLPGGRLIFQL